MLSIDVKMASLRSRPVLSKKDLFGTRAVAPSASWDGTASSGFASVPVDPERITAKPILRMVTRPLVTMTDSLVVGAMAIANNGGTLIGGIDRVRFHFEGRSVDVLTPSFRVFTRRDGSTYLQLAYWVELHRPPLVEGEAHMFVEAIPADATMQKRVIGPYKYLCYESEFTHERVVDPASSEIRNQRYTSLERALNNLRSVDAQRSRITINAASLTLAASNPAPYSAGQCVVIEASQPCVIQRDAINQGDARLRHSGVIMRGPNLSIDVRHISRFIADNGQEPLSLEGVRVFNSGGRDELWNKGTRPVTQIFGVANKGGAWLTDCEFEGTFSSAMSNLNLARGCTFQTVNGDVFSQCRATFNCNVADLDNRFWRNERDALSLTAPSGATLALSGVNDANERTFTAKENGTLVDQFTVGKTSAYRGTAQFNVANVVHWLNSLPGWSATLIDDTRRATGLSLPGTTGNAFGDTDVSAGVTLVTQFDLHSDIWQMGGAANENIIAMDCSAVGINSQLIHLADADDYKDMAFVNVTGLLNDGRGENSNFEKPSSHVIVAHCSLPNQTLQIRPSPSRSFASDAYCLFANNVIEGISDQGLDYGPARISANHYPEASNGPSTGETEASFGGTIASLFVDAAGGDFTQAGELLTNLKVPVWALALTEIQPRPAGLIYPETGSPI